MRPLAWALLTVNLLAFALMGWDKGKAGRGSRRVRERTLFLFPLLGGALGGTVGMLLFHHKTRKWYFAYGLPLLAIVQLLLLGWLKAGGAGR